MSPPRGVNHVEKVKCERRSTSGCRAACEANHPGTRRSLIGGIALRLQCGGLWQHSPLENWRRSHIVLTSLAENNGREVWPRLSINTNRKTVPFPKSNAQRGLSWPARSTQHLASPLDIKDVEEKCSFVERRARLILCRIAYVSCGECM
jgi:hypothetical protein